MVHVKIKQVGQNTNDWSNSYGWFRDFPVRVLLDGADQGETVFTIARKLDREGGTCRVPAAGDEFDAELQPRDGYPTKLKRIDRSQGAGGGGGFQAGGSGGGNGRSEDREASIVRQHSQEMAIRCMAMNPPPDSPDVEELLTLINWFFEDAWNATPPETAQPEPQQDSGGDGFEQPPPDDNPPF